MIDLAVKNVYLRTINLGFLERIRIGIVFDLFVYIFHGARNWVKTCRPAFLTSDSREMAFTDIHGDRSLTTLLLDSKRYGMGTHQQLL